MNERGYALKTAPANRFIGKKPAAVIFGDERVEVKKWMDVYRLVYERVCQSPQGREDLMSLRNRVLGKVRVFISDSPAGMTRPLKVDEEIFVEAQYGVETMFHIMIDCVLKYVRYDLSDIKVVLKR